MVKVSTLFLLLSSFCLASPVMADQKSSSKMTFQEILESSKQLDHLDDGDYDDGDYADVPVASKPKVKAKPEKQAKAKAKVKAKPVAVKKQVDKKVKAKAKPVATKKQVDTKAKVYALKDDWNKRSTVDPFE